MPNSSNSHRAFRRFVGTAKRVLGLVLLVLEVLRRLSELLK